MLESYREEGRATVLNEFAWNQKANMLFIDQPVGAGFSYASLVSIDPDRAY